MLNGNLSHLFTDGVLVNVDIRFWAGQKKLQAKDVGLDEDKIPDIYSLGRKRLLPAEVISRFRSFAERADYLLECEAFKFPIAKLRFVPRTRLGSLVSALDACQAEFGACATEFFGNYQRIRDRMLDEYAAYREALEAYYPPLSQVRKKFSFHYDLFNIALPKDLKLAQTTAAKVDREQKALAAAEARLREQAVRQVDAFLADTVATLREKTTDLCEHVATKIRKGDLVTEATLNSLKDWIDRFESLNFVGDRTVAQQLAHLRRTLGTRSAQEYRENGRAAQALGTALTHIITAANDLSDVASVTGAYKRRIRLD